MLIDSYKSDIFVVVVVVEVLFYLKDDRKMQIEFRHLGKIRAALQWSAAGRDVASSN